MVGGKGIDVRLKHIMRKVDQTIILPVYFFLGVLTLLFRLFMYPASIGKMMFNKGRKTNYLKPEAWF